MFSNVPCRARGMTLIELVIAIVVIAVGVAGVLLAFNQTVFHSADTLIRKQMLAVADEMMDEISLKPYAPVANAPSGGCARSTFNDVSDYNGYASVGICDIDGSAIASLASYDVVVTVTNTALPDGVAAKRIVVTVSHGTDMLTLIGYRTGWAS